MIYLDSCIVIYLVEKHPVYYAPLERRFREAAQAGFSVSPLVLLECLVGPLKRRDDVLEARFERFFAAVTVLPHDETVFRKAARLRARGIKTPDALHLATAEHYGCTELWTNDNRLAKVSALAVNVLEA